MQKGIMNSLHSVKEEVKEGMLKSYIAISNRVKDFFTDKRAVSHLLEVVGVLALAALILVVVFPGARNTITNIWSRMSTEITKAFSNTSTDPLNVPTTTN